MTFSSLRHKLLFITPLLMVAIYTTTILGYAHANAPVDGLKLNNAPQRQTLNSTEVLLPMSIITQRGETDEGQSVTNLHLQDQSGTDDNWEKYVDFVSENRKYRGYRSYTLPNNINPASIVGMTIKVNYRGPAKSQQRWTWKIYDWSNETWVFVGNNNSTPSWTNWHLFTFTISENHVNYVHSTTREVRVRVEANNRSDNMILDYEAVIVDVGNVTPPTPTATATSPSPTATNTATQVATDTPANLVLLPADIVTLQGQIGNGQSVTNLHQQDQSGSEGNSEWSQYIEFISNNIEYQGYRTYYLPSQVNPTFITGLQVEVNYLGPAKNEQTWTWQLYNWADQTWVTIGDNQGISSWGYWQPLTFSTTDTLANYVHPVTGQIKLGIGANNTSDNMDLDYEAIVVTVGNTHQPTATFTPTASPMPTNTPTQTHTLVPSHTPTNTPLPITPQPPSSQIFYVSPTGNDTNLGTIDAPWRTIQKAASSVQAGSTVYVRSGIYAETVDIQVSGSAQGGYITFENYQDELAIIDGTELTVTDDDTGLIKIENQTYIIISGFELRNYKTNKNNRVPVGIRVGGTAHHIQLLQNKIHTIKTEVAGGNAHGIVVMGTNSRHSVNNIIINNNELYDLDLGSSEALVLNGNVENFEIAHNKIHNVDNIGIDIIGWEGTAFGSANDQARNGTIHHNQVYNISSTTNPAYGYTYGAAGIYVDGGRDVVIEYNFVHHNDYGIELASEHQGKAASNITVRNNFIYANKSAGIAIGGYDTQRGGVENCIIVNNTLFNNSTQQEGEGEIYIQNHTANNQIANNIFYQLAENILFGNNHTENSGNVIDYNIYFTPNGANDSIWLWENSTYHSFTSYQNGTGNDAHSRFIDPKFVNVMPDAPNLHLQDLSPAIDQGHSAVDAGRYDIDNEARTIGPIDIGADEALLGAISQEGTVNIFLPIISKNYQP